MHLAAGFLGEHAEQQRFGQAGLLVFRPHQIAHVFVVDVRRDEIRPVLRQPFFERGLDRPVHRDHVGELATLEQRDRAAELRHRGDDRRAFAGFLHGFGRRPGGFASGFLIRLAAGREPQQAIERGDETLLLATCDRAALRRRGAKIVERRGDFGLGLIVLARARKRKAVLVALGILIEPRVQRVDAGIVDLRRCSRVLLRGCCGAGSERRDESDDGNSLNERH